MSKAFRGSLRGALCWLAVYMFGCQSQPDAPFQPGVIAPTGPDQVSAALLQSALAPEERGARWSAPLRGVPQRYREFARAFDAERAELGIPGAAVALIERGRVSFARGFGVRAIGSSDSVDANTLFRVGSLTKALTATALLSAAQEHGVSMEQKVPELLPELQVSGPELSSLTLHHLLSHRSGISDYISLVGPDEDAGLEQYLSGSDFASQVRFMVPPGTFYNYSNTNYAIAGFALERIDGQYYRQAVRARVLEPIGMRRTYFTPSEVLADGNYAAGNVPGDAEFERVEPDAYDNAWARPAGFAFSSVLDYARFLEFLLRGNPRVLSSAMHEAMLTSHGSTHEFGDYFGYGYGLVIGSAMQLGTDFYEERVVLHDGRIPGYLSLFALFPDAQFGVVVLVNSEAGIPGKLAIEQFVQLPPPQPLPADVLPDVARYPAYAGTYEDPHVAGTIVVTAQDGELHVAISAADVEGVAYDEVLQPTSLDNFVLVLDGQPLPVTFLKDDTGTYNLIRTRSLVAKRAAGAP